MIVSVSLFSLLFSRSTLISFLHYFNFYFSTLPFKLLSHTLDKNCTFLLCNGLLVFLAKYSGLFNSSSSSSNYNMYSLTDHDHESFKNYEDHDDVSQSIETTTDINNEIPLILEQEADELLESTQPMETNNAMQHEIENKKSEEAEEKHIEEEEPKEELEEEEEENDHQVPEEDKEAERSFFIEEIVEEEDEEEEGNDENLSNEELNKKFDDFIRKMKEELRIEARQQLIMV